MYYDFDAFVWKYDGIPVVIYGTGNYGKFMFNKLTAAEICVDSFTCIFEDMLWFRIL